MRRHPSKIGSVLVSEDYIELNDDEPKSFAKKAMAGWVVLGVLLTVACASIVHPIESSHWVRALASTSEYGNAESGDPSVMHDPPKGMAQISYDSDVVCGVTRTNDIFCSSRQDNKEGWYKIPGKLKQVAKCGQRLVGVNHANRVFVGWANKNPRWTRLQGSLQQVSCSGNHICGVTTGNDIYCTRYRPNKAPRWWRVDGKLRQVALVQRLAYGLDLNSNLIVGRIRGTPQWVELPGQLKSISVDEKHICGVTVANDVYCSSRIQGSLRWKRLNTKGVSVAVSDHWLIILTDQNTVQVVELDEQCSRICTRKYAPVCGSDGKTYSNSCMFGIAQCENKSLRIVSTGECKSPPEECNRICTREYAPVCGSDGKTYSNSCMFGIAQCEVKDLRMVSTGECDSAPEPCTTFWGVG